jgi:hypothetical protein
MHETQSGSQVMAFLPLVLLSCVWGIFLISVQRHKGKRRWFHYIQGFIPVWNFPFYAYWLLTLTNVDIMERVNLTNEILRQVLDNLRFHGSTPAKWTCQCGQANDMETANCPTCGLKRDFVLKKPQSE